MEKVFSYLAQFFDMVGELRRLRAIVDKHDAAEEARAKRETQILLAFQNLPLRVDRLEKTEELERQKLALQLENEMLRFERRLPPENRP